MFRSLAAAALAAAVLCAGPAHATRYLVTYEGTGHRGSNICWDLYGACTELPSVPINSPFKAQFVFDDTLGLWGNNGNEFFYGGPFEYIKISIGNLNFNNHANIGNTAFWMYNHEGEQLILTSYFTTDVYLDFLGGREDLFYDMGEFTSRSTLMQPYSIDYVAHGTAQFPIKIDVDHYRVDITKVTISAVPEPATWAMMMVGFGLAGAGLRRSRGRRLERRLLPLAS